MQQIQRKCLNPRERRSDNDGPYAVLEDSEQDDEHIDAEDSPRHVDGGIFFVQDKGNRVKADGGGMLADTEVILSTTLQI